MKLTESKLRQIIRETIREGTVQISRDVDADFRGNMVQLIGRKAKVPLSKRDLKALIYIIRKHMGRSYTEDVQEGHKIVFSKDEMAKLHKDGKLEKDGHTYIFSEGKITEGKRIKLPSGIVIDIGMNYLKVYNYDGKEIPFDKNEVLKFIRASRQRMRLV